MSVQNINEEIPLRLGNFYISNTSVQRSQGAIKITPATKNIQGALPVITSVTPITFNIVGEITGETINEYSTGRKEYGGSHIEEMIAIRAWNFGYNKELKSFYHEYYDTYFGLCKVAVTNFTIGEQIEKKGVIPITITLEGFPAKELVEIDFFKQQENPLYKFQKNITNLSTVSSDTSQGINQDGASLSEMKKAIKKDLDITDEDLDEALEKGVPGFYTPEEILAFFENIESQIRNFSVKNILSTYINKIKNFPPLLLFQRFQDDVLNLASDIQEAFNEAVDFVDFIESTTLFSILSNLLDTLPDNYLVFLKDKNPVLSDDHLKIKSEKHANITTINITRSIDLYSKMYGIGVISAIIEVIKNTKAYIPTAFDFTNGTHISKSFFRRDLIVLYNKITLELDKLLTYKNNIAFFRVNYNNQIILSDDLFTNSDEFISYIQKTKAYLHDMVYQNIQELPEIIKQPTTKSFSEGYYEYTREDFNKYFVVGISQNESFDLYKNQEYFGLVHE